jgi:predicted XRE-type DNA-binding protein
MGMPRPDADIWQVKCSLSIAIDRVIQERGLSQKRAAAIVGLDQPKISLIKSGELRGFTVERLLKVLSRLGFSINITLEKTREMGGPIRCILAEAKSPSRRAPKRRAA